jgi:hypothetical protein
VFDAKFPLTGAQVSITLKSGERSQYHHPIETRTKIREWDGEEWGVTFKNLFIHQLFFPLLNYFKLFQSVHSLALPLHMEDSLK